MKRGKLFESSNTAQLSREQIATLPTPRLEKYRKKLLKVIGVNSFCDCCGEPLEYLYPDEDYSDLYEVIHVKAMVNDELRTRNEL